MNRMKLAELTSGVGALVLGVGLGAIFAEWLQQSAIAIASLGLVTHAFGMWDKHRLESRMSNGDPWWVTLLYWTCWLGLAAIAVWLLVAAL